MCEAHNLKLLVLNHLGKYSGLWSCFQNENYKAKNIKQLNLDYVIDVGVCTQGFTATKKGVHFGYCIIMIAFPILLTRGRHVDFNKFLPSSGIIQTFNFNNI